MYTLASYLVHEFLIVACMQLERVVTCEGRVLSKGRARKYFQRLHLELEYELAIVQPDTISHKDYKQWWCYVLERSVKLRKFGGLRWDFIVCHLISAYFTIFPH